MVSSIGYNLNNSTKITGFGYRRPCYRGHGVGRQIAGSIVNHAGHALINRIAKAISGTGIRRKRRYTRKTGGTYVLTGAGRRHRRVGRPRTRTCGLGIRQTYRRKPGGLSGIRRRHRTTRRVNRILIT